MAYHYFLTSKNYKIHVRLYDSITVKVFGGIYLCNGRDLENSEDYTCFFVISCVSESNRSFLTSELLSNISLVVG